MVQNSEEIWTEILNNQNHDLIGTTIPNEGNGYHDGLSWHVPYHQNKEYNEELLSNTFFTIYLRDLGLFMNPSLSKKEKFEANFEIINRTNNYYKTLIKYLPSRGYRHYGDVLDVLGQWGESLSHEGRLVFEIINWYDNKSSRFYAYQLNLLKNEYCKIGRKKITYKAPFKSKGNNVTLKKVKIPKKKCIVIEFPEELGGYKGFQKKIKLIKGLGSQHLFSINDPGKSLEHSK